MSWRVFNKESESIRYIFGIRIQTLMCKKWHECILLLKFTVFTIKNPKI